MSDLAKALIALQQQNANDNIYLNTGRSMQGAFAPIDPNWSSGEQIAYSLMSTAVPGILEGIGRRQVEADNLKMQQDLTAMQKALYAGESLDPFKESSAYRLSPLLERDMLEDQMKQQRAIAAEMNKENIRQMGERHGSVTPDMMQTVLTPSGTLIRERLKTPEANPLAASQPGMPQMPVAASKATRLQQKIEEYAQVLPRAMAEKQALSDLELEDSQLNQELKGLSELSAGAQKRQGLAQNIKSSLDVMQEKGGNVGGTFEMLEVAQDALMSSLGSKDAQARRNARSTIEGALTEIAKSKRVSGEGPMSDRDFDVLLNIAKAGFTTTKDALRAANALEAASKREQEKEQFLREMAPKIGLGEAKAIFQNYVETVPIFTGAGSENPQPMSFAEYLQRGMKGQVPEGSLAHSPEQRQQAVQSRADELTAQLMSEMGL